MAAPGSMRADTSSARWRMPTRLTSMTSRSGNFDPGQPGAVEERVDRASDVLDGGRRGVGIAQVDRLVARHLHRRFLEVEHMDFGPQLAQMAHGGGTHARSAAAAHDDPAAFVTPRCCHLRPSFSFVQAVLLLSGACSSGQTQSVLGHDVAVDVAGAAGDRIRGRHEQSLGPGPVEVLRDRGCSPPARPAPGRPRPRPAWPTRPSSPTAAHPGRPWPTPGTWSTACRRCRHTDAARRSRCTASRIGPAPARPPRAAPRIGRSGRGGGGPRRLARG